MSSVTHPKGRLPARVYWFRRALVLLVAFGLVFVLAQLLGGNGSDSSSNAADRAAAASKKTKAAPPQVGPVAVETTAAKKKPAPAVLAAPDGRCAASEVAVAPSVRRAYAGRKMRIDLNFSSTRAACTFSVSPESLAVRITSGSDSVWSSQQCPASIPKTEIVVRSATPTNVPMIWDARRSDDDCSVSAGFAKAGFYHVSAAALGSEPGDVQFELQNPPRAVITRTATPRPHKKATAPGQATKPTHSPSGAVEPDTTRR